MIENYNQTMYFNREFIFHLKINERFQCAE